MMNMKTLGSDKSEFKMWNDKLINAIAQVRGREWRMYLRELNQRLDKTRIPLNDQDLMGLPSYNLIKDVDGVNEDLYCVLVEKKNGRRSSTTSE